MNNSSKNPLAQLDLNLLRLFLRIYQLKNLTHTAEQLHLSQSAISHALGRLRQALGDELFYREKGELHPTLYARQIYPNIVAIFEQLQQTLSPIPTDDVAALATQATHRFRHVTIAMQDEVELIVFDKLVARLRQLLPDCQLTSSRLNRHELEHELKVGQMDFAIDVARAVSEELVHQPLMQDDFVLAFYAPNFAQGITQQLPLDNRWYFANQHITVSSRRLGLSIEDSLLSEAGWHRQIKIRCQHYATACQLLAQDKLLLTLPRQLAHTFIPATSDWQVMDLPIQLPTIELHGYWHKNREHDLLYQWLRRQLFAALA